MSSESKKPAKTSAKKSVGEMLKKRRTALKLSLKEVERATRIRGKYLLAIEDDDYRELPHDVYTRGFIQSYARFVGLDTSEIEEAYSQQRGQQELQLRRASRMDSPRIALTPRLLTLVGAFIVGAVISGYLIWQLSALTAPPNLIVSNPAKDQVLYGSLIRVSGQVDGGADVFVNDSPILVDGSGKFTDDIALQDGVNSINVSAKNHLGKTTTVTRNILTHVPKTDPASVLPPQPFDGVGVSVLVKGSASTVKVTIDGKQSFNGTMLPGTSLTFKGTRDVVISTSNAGATSLTVTNSLVAGKSLGTLGQNGQAKTDFKFSKDTQFQ